MEQDNNSLEGGNTRPDYLNGLETAPAQVSKVNIRRRPSLFKFNKLAFLVTGGALALILLVSVAGIVFTNLRNKDNEVTSQKGKFTVSKLSVNNVDQNQLQVEQADKLNVNGQLKVSNTLVLAPTTAPSAPTVGQIYYDKTTNALYYYNGSAFVPVATQNAIVSSLGGSTGAINVGTGLSSSGGTLQNTGVTSIQGQTGDVNFSVSNGLAISGTNISLAPLPAGQLVLGTGSSGFTTVPQAASAGLCLVSTTGAPVFGSCTGQTTVNNIVVGSDQLNGNITLQGSGVTIGHSGNTVTFTVASGGNVSQSGYTQNRLTKFDNSGNIQNSALLEVTNGLQVASNAYSLDLYNSGSNSTLTIQNTDGTRVANLSVEGSISTAVGILTSNNKILAIPAPSSGTSYEVCYVDDNNASNCPTGGDVVKGGTFNNDQITGTDGSGNLVTTGLYYKTSTATDGIRYNGSSYDLELYNNGIATLNILNGNGSNKANLVVSGTINPQGGFVNSNGDLFSLDASPTGTTRTLCYVDDALASNCPSGGDVSKGTHTTGYLTKFDSSGNILNSSVLDQTTGLQAAGSGYYLDILNNGAASTLTVKNTGSGGQVANVAVTGSVTASGGLYVAANKGVENDTLNGGLKVVAGPNNNDSIVFYTRDSSGNLLSFKFASSGGLDQTICTSGITCASGGGQAVLLQPNDNGSPTPNAQSQDFAGSIPGIWLNQTSGSGNIFQLQRAGKNAFVVDSTGAVNLGNISTTIGQELQGKLVFSDGTNSGYGVTIQVGDGSTPIGQNSLLVIPDTVASSDEICTKNSGNCTGTPGGPSNFINNQSTTQTSANFNIQSVADATVTAVLKARATQTANLLQFQDSNGLVMGSVSASGSQLNLGRISASGTVSQGKIVFSDGTNSGFGVTLQVSDGSTQLGADKVLTIPATMTANDEICTKNSGNCTGTPGGPSNFINNQDTTQTDANFNIQSAGDASVTAVLKARSGQIADLLQAQSSTGTVLAYLSKDGDLSVKNTTVNGTLAVTSTSTFTGLGTFNGGITVGNNSSFDQSGSSGTFKTGTGAVSINGDTTLATNKSLTLQGTGALTVGTGATSLGGTLAVTGAGSFDGVLNVGKSGSTGSLNLFNTNGNKTLLQAGASSGDLTFVLPIDSGSANYCLKKDPSNTTQLVWDACLGGSGGGGGVSSLGALDGQSPDAKGAAISSGVLYLQSASASYPGLVNTTSQTFAGAKTFNALATFNLGIAASGATSSINASSNFDTNINTGSSTGAVNIGNSAANTISVQSSGSINLTPGGTSNTGVLVKPTNDSTAAFQIQNAAGNSLLNVDSANANITLNGTNYTAIQSWQTGTNTGFNARETQATVTANGYIYVIGGKNSSNVSVNDVQYAKILSNGNVSSWSTATGTLGGVRDHPSAAYYNGYIYVTGGSTNETDANAQDTVYYGKVGNDGNITAWNTGTAINVSGSQKRWGHTTLAYNGYLYVIGGKNTAGTAQQTVYYAKINADGSIGTWASTGQNLQTGVARHSSMIANGYMYAIGGGISTVQYARINANGTTAAWQTGTSMPASRTDAGIAVANGTVYIVAGNNGSSYLGSTYSGTIGSTGDITNWKCQGSVGNCTGATSIDTTALPSGATRAEFGTTPLMANGYIYQIGGWNGGVAQSNVYYTSTARLAFNGSLDLVGTSGQNLNEGGTGGSLTAGNTNIIGTLQVQGAANFNQGMSIAGTLNVGDQVAFKNGTDSTSAFVVQNSSGNNLLNIDTSASTVSIGSVGSSTYASTVNIASTSDGTNTQAVSIGSNAKSTNTTTLSGYTNTVQATLGGLNLKTINTTSSASGAVAITSGATTGSSLNSGAISIATGNVNTSGNSGAVTISTGSTASGTAGGISIQPNGAGNTGVTVIPTNNSTAAFKIQNASSVNLFNADTTNMTVTINTAPPAPKLGSGTAYPTTGLGVAVTSADFNGDGYADLATLDYFNSKVTILMNNGNGTFAAGVDYTTGSTPYGVAAGDFNGDGRPDLATSNSGASTVSVLLNNGNGTFGTKQDFATTAAGWTGITVADFSGDGRADIAVGTNTTTMSVFTNNGFGTSFTRADYTVGGTAYGIAAADFNSDGRLDIATANNSTNNMSYLINSGSGAFGAATTIAASTGPYAVTAADFSGDGKADIAVANSNGGNVSVYINNGSGTMAAALNYTACSFAQGITSADFNGDGVIDVATSCNGGSVAVLVNNGSGTFATAVTYAAGSSPWGVTSADFNGDKKTDLAVANFFGTSISVYNSNESSFAVKGFSDLNSVNLTAGSVLSSRGSVILQNATNSNAALQILNAAGQNLLTADTTNMRISIGPKGTATGQLYISGQTPSAVLGQANATYASGGIAVQGRYAFLVPANGTTGYIQSYDVSNPASPVYVDASTPTKSSNQTSSGASNKKIKIQGKYAYVAGGGTLQVFDISNPYAPASVGTQTYTSGGSFTSLYVQGRYAYVSASGVQALYIFDISNPANIPAATTFSSGFGTTSVGAMDIYVQGRYLYAANNSATTNSFQVIDISNPTSPSVTASLSSVTGTPSSVTVQGKYAYMGTTSDLYAINVGNPASLSSVNISLGGPATSVTSNSRYVYVADSSNSVIRTVDISTPGTPALVYGTVSSAAGYALQVSGRYLYLSSNSATNTIQTFDLGGTYSQQLEAGNIETDQLYVRGNTNLASDASIQGSLAVGSNANIQGSLAVGGTSTFAGNLTASGYATATATYSTTVGATTNTTSITVNSATGFAVNDVIYINNAGQDYYTRITNISTNTFTVSPAVDVDANSGSTPAVTKYVVQNIGSSLNGPPTTNSERFFQGYFLGGVVTGAGSTTLSDGNLLSTTALNISGTSIKLQASSNSSTAFRVQNSTGANLLQIDSSSNTITLGGNLSAELTWGTSSGTITARYGAGSASWNGYIYTSGGYNASNGVQNNIQYIKVNADGTTGNGSVSSNTFTTARWATQSVAANGYLYVIGGYDNTNTALTNVSWAKIQPNGDVGAWTAGTGGQLLPATRAEGRAVYLNGYIYYLGGMSNISTYVSTIYYAKVNADGSLGSWATASTTMPATMSRFGATVANGNILIFGGSNGSGLTASYSVAPASSGNITAGWTAGGSFAAGRYAMGAAVANGYVYSIGGFKQGDFAYNNIIFYAPISTTGTIGSWVQATGTLPANRGLPTTAAVNGNVYIVGGDNSGAQSSIYYGTTQKIKVGGALDLVGLVGGSLSDGQSALGGELTAGNTNVIGSLFVQGQAGFRDSVSISGTLSVANQAVFQNSSNSTSAVQVQNASGTAIFTVDTTNGRICIAMATCNNALGVTGNIAATGTITTSGTPDIAESIPISGDVDAWEVVSADPNNTESAVRTSVPYDPTMIGIISDGSSAFKIDSNTHTENIDPSTLHYLVLAGRVPVKVTNEGGEIKPGDYLTSSSTPGYAMKATHAGPTIGKALGFFSGTSGTVMVQTNLSYADPQPNLQGSDGAFSDLNVSGIATIQTLNVTGVATFQGNIIVGGHIITQGATPTIDVLGAAGAGATIDVDGNDTAGTITITIAGGASAGDLGKFNFNSPFSKAPKTILSPQDDASQDAKVFASGKTGSAFNLKSTQALQPGTYTFDYFIVQ